MKSGTERGDQLWRHAQETTDPASHMQGQWQLAVKHRDYLTDQWREANRLIASLEGHMREAGIETPSQAARRDFENG